MATSAARILDRSRFEARARVGDVLALGLVLAMGAAMVFEMYSLGYTASQASGEGGGLVFERDRGFVRVLIEGFVAAAGLFWIAYRLLVASARRVGG